jgi:hypothetical protein
MRRITTSALPAFFVAILHFALFSAACSAQQSPAIPAGTILPISLDHSFSSKNAKPGQHISAHIKQDVPLLGDAKIPAGTKLSGQITAVTAKAQNAPAKIAFRFDAIQLNGKSLPLSANLRALANFMSVEFAQVPETPLGFGTPYVWATRQQIGGDQVYGVDGPVHDRDDNPVGHSTNSGVLVHVRASTNDACRGPLNTNDPASDDRLQALWVFSSDACGLYGMDNITLAHAGRSEPFGEIILSSEKHDVLVRAGSGMLVRVIRQNPTRHQ